MGSLDANPAGFAAFGAGVDTGFQPLNAEDVRSYLHKSVEFIYDYFKTVESLPVLPGVEPGYLRRLLQSAPPTSSAPFDIAIKEVRDAVVPGMTHWASPNFFAFFPSTNSATAIAGELIASAMNTVGFTWQANPAATEMEVLALDWLAQLLRLPATFMNRTASGRGTGGGVILGTTSEAMLVTLVAARDAALRRIGSDGVAGITEAHRLRRRSYPLHPRIWDSGRMGRNSVKFVQLARSCSWRRPHAVRWSATVDTAGWPAAAAPAAKPSTTPDLVMMRRQELQHHGRRQHMRVHTINFLGVCMVVVGSHETQTVLVAIDKC